MLTILTRILLAVVIMLVVGGCVQPASAATGREVQARIDADLKAGRPVVVHVIVALCDRQNQGIIPSNPTLENGQDPANNQYWGAIYGVKSFLPRKAGWEVVEATKPVRESVLEQVIFRAVVKRGGIERKVYLVAEAWDGKEIKGAVEKFLSMAAGWDPINFKIGDGQEQIELPAGGQAQLVVYVGHDGLMDFALDRFPEKNPEAKVRSSMVLACLSERYFKEPLDRGGSHPLLLTSGLMAPEAYALDAAIRSWMEGEPASAVRDRMAAAYHQYQRCGLAFAKGLFVGE